MAPKWRYRAHLIRELRDAGEESVMRIREPQEAGQRREPGQSKLIVVDASVVVDAFVDDGALG